ncbi:SDR family oxidoreductase [Hymenobacter properus]|uniref:dTDP-4-dehydrorhamnose reductase n=1 Tax=Hymenobacter properus TaxID=2791026 RepID=A0A931BFZ2_9BACT|nr:NAD(P)-dependent oxidoreductase [Hymenobacter properus]MBF9141728.1 NAD(P)-dependent oxidoreductase [Hymenobacter properus]MBR7720537.1 NAD(P)-dependent oxidoreductase [Microvirga sp. SRT04]
MRPDFVPEHIAEQDIRPLLIAGANGTLGRAFGRICHTRGLVTVALGRDELDIISPVSVEKALDTIRPWAVVNAAGYVRVDEAENDAGQCFSENATGPSVLATACAARGLSFLTFSSDLVFDGQQAEPYTESAKPNPLNVYGRSKLAAEQRVLAVHPQALVVRTSAFFSAWDEFNFVYFALEAARARRRFEVADDVRISPTYVPDLVNASLDLLMDEAHGIWHVVNDGACTWAELARMAAERAGLSSDFLVPRPMAEFNLPAARPAQSVLRSENGMVLPSLDDTLNRCVGEMRHHWAV